MNEEYMCDSIQFIGDEKCIALLCIDCWKELSPLKEELHHIIITCLLHMVSQLYNQGSSTVKLSINIHSTEQ